MKTPETPSKYRIQFYDWTALVEVTDVEKAVAAAKAVNEFFIDHEYRVEKADGDVIKAALACYAPEIIANSHRGIAGVLEHLATCEGYAPLDGSQGLKLIQCDRWCWLEEEFQIDPAN